MSKEAPPPYEGANAPALSPKEGIYPPIAPNQSPAGIYPPPPSHHAGQLPIPQPQTMTLTTTTAPTLVGPNPMATTCPHCHENITTIVDIAPTTKTHLFAAGLCLCGCWLCAFLPYCMDSCQGKKHTCPHCKAFLGSYSD